MKTLLFLFILVSLSGCNVSSSTTATFPTESQTPTVQSTASLLPTSTQTPAQPTSSPLPTLTQTPTLPTLTPEPELRTNGPYFGYFRHVPGFSAFQFVLMDTDGVGRKVIDLPDEVTGTSPTDVRYVSPDGKWLAFYTGSAGNANNDMAVPGAYDLTLNLLDLTTGEKQTVTPLLSKDYPTNFVEAVKEINESYLTETLQSAFLDGITQALAWSPDGRYLAFAGQMDGLSSDPYLYDLTTKEIQRLPSDNEELQWVKWSPDGKWILHGSRLSNGSLFAEYSIYVVARDNSSFHNLGYGFAGDWLNSHKFLEYRFGIERYQLRLVDVNTGKITEIWKGYFGGYNVDPTGTWVVVDAISSAVPPEKDEPGFIYGVPQLINLKSLERIQALDPLSNTPTSFPLSPFLRAKDGLVVQLSNWTILASPDMKYWVEAIKRGIKIYTYDLALVHEIPIPLQESNPNYELPLDMQWSPDSSYLFLVYGRFKKTLYVINISNGDVNLVDSPVDRGRWFNINH
jgi:hypothetical protein